jgi:hypothetical protein
MDNSTARQIPKLLSKTRLMRSYQCLKSGYLTIHNHELEPPIGPELQALFDQGNEVTLQARLHFPNGKLVENPPWDFVGALKKTREMIAAQNEIIFEAAFEYKGCFARADILIFSKETQRWSIVEVKSTTKLKPEHLDDIGLQTWIMANAGLPIEKISLMHLNPLCKYPDLKNLFSTTDITDELRKKHTSISPRLTEIFKTLKATIVPDIDLGQHCFIPNECPFWSHCKQEKKIPEISLFDIPNLRDKKWILYNEGLVDIHHPKLSESEGLSPLQKQQLHCLQTGEVYIQKDAIQQALSNWQWPLTFLDFETINPAIPRFDGCNPYSQVPFQYSLHISNSLGEKPIHFYYLHCEKNDPRRSLAESLVANCPKLGSVVAYYSKFEATRLQELEDLFPDLHRDLKSIRERLVDPLPIFREHVYFADFKSSFSLKSVAPAILGEKSSYKHLIVSNGGEAQRAYEKMCHFPSENPKKNEIFQQLLDYCNQDTFVLLQLTEWLINQSKND